MRAYESLKIENKVEFVEEMKINIEPNEKAFFVGPFKSSLVQDYSLDQDKDNFLFMNYSEIGKFIPTNKMMQINLIEYFFNLSEGYKFDVIASKNEIEGFKSYSNFPYQLSRTNLNFYSILVLLLKIQPSFYLPQKCQKNFQTLSMKK